MFMETSDKSGSKSGMAEFKTKVTTYYVQYRVTLVVEYLCWVDLDLGSSPGCSYLLPKQDGGTFQI